MSFNTALSGLRAANQDLAVTGNNIANASTTGFKYWIYFIVPLKQ